MFWNFAFFGAKYTCSKKKPFLHIRCRFCDLRTFDTVHFCVKKVPVKSRELVSHILKGEMVESWFCYRLLIERFGVNITKNCFEILPFLVQNISVAKNSFFTHTLQILWFKSMRYRPFLCEKSTIQITRISLAHTKWRDDRIVLLLPLTHRTIWC